MNIKDIHDSDVMLDDYDQDHDYTTEVLSGVTKVTETAKAYLFSKKNRQAWFPKVAVELFEDDVLEYYTWFDPEWVEPAKEKKKMGAIEGDFE